MPGSISPGERDTEGACSSRLGPMPDPVPRLPSPGAGLTRLELAPPPASSCGRSFRRAHSALQVDEQQRNRGWSDARNSRGLSDRLRSVLLQFLLHFDRQATDALVIEIARQQHRLVAPSARDFFTLTLDIPLVFGLNLHL